MEVCAPADEDVRIPQPLDAYDGVAITGSALNIYKREAGSLRQIDFMREVFTRGIPTFGSCWGLQVAVVAAGGEVGPNPRGREVAFARKITLNEAGRVHPMHAGRPLAFDAPGHSWRRTRRPAAGNDRHGVEPSQRRAGGGNSLWSRRLLGRSISSRIWAGRCRSDSAALWGAVGRRRILSDVAELEALCGRSAEPRGATPPGATSLGGWAWKRTS